MDLQARDGKVADVTPDDTRTADPQSQAAHYPPSVVIVNGKIDSIWREPADATTWAARLGAQARSYGGTPHHVSVAQLPYRFSTIEVVARTVDDDHVRFAPKETP